MYFKDFLIKWCVTKIGILSLKDKDHNTDTVLRINFIKSKKNNNNINIEIILI